MCRCSHRLEALLWEGEALCGCSVPNLPLSYSLMKEARKMVSRCTYLNILLQTQSSEVLVKWVGIWVTAMGFLGCWWGTRSVGCGPSKIQEGHQILLLPAHRFIDVGGYKLLNNWLTYSKTTNNIPLLQQILLTLQHLPLTVDHLKQVPSVFPTSVPRFSGWAWQMRNLHWLWAGCDP